MILRVKYPNLDWSNVTEIQAKLIANKIRGGITQETLKDGIKLKNPLLVSIALKELTEIPSGSNSPMNNSPLNVSVVFYGTSEEALETYKMLLLDPRTNPLDSLYSMMYAIATRDTELVRNLLQNQEYVNRLKTPYGQNVLQFAIEKDNAEILQLLILAGMDPSYDYQRGIKLAGKRAGANVISTLLRDNRVDPTIDNGAALVNAIKAENFEAVEALLVDTRVHGKINQSGRGRDSFLDIAAETGNVEIITLLINRGAMLSEYTIGNAAKSGSLDAVKLIWAEPALDRNKYWYTGLLGGIISAPEEQVLPITEFFLLRLDPGEDQILPDGVGPSALKRSSNMAVYHAAVRNRADIVKLLRSFNVDSLSDREALYGAANRGYTDVVAVLLSDPDLTWYDGLIANVARDLKNSEVLRILLEYSHDVKYYDPTIGDPITSATYGNNPEGVRILLSYPRVGSNVEDVQKALKAARESGYNEIVELLS
jgi:ankyrin repeat protein